MKKLLDSGKLGRPERSKNPAELQRTDDLFYLGIFSADEDERINFS